MVETGTKDVKTIQDSIKAIKTLTKNFEMKRITLTEYTLRLNQILFNLDSKRDYIMYLKQIGQYI
jgi:2-polyprenyl-3-methyl-5-hydroxy-6-metoxy-1,4-benzoquinol methylase